MDSLPEHLPPALPVSFFEQDTVCVAQALLGQRLIRILSEGEGQQRQIKQYKIVETEAYTQEDPACHGYQRTTGRAATLYKEPGLAYVYFIYGMYFCLNVVTETAGRGGAVLFRALEPLTPPVISEDKLLKTNGPGRLTRALGITKAEFNEKPLTTPETGLYLAAGKPILPSQQVQTTRIGIRQAQELPWRFYIQENPWVSVRAPKSPQ